MILKLGHRPRRRCSLKVFFSIFSSANHFVQPSVTILAILVKRDMRKISVNIFLNWATGLKDAVLRFLYFYLYFWQPFCSAEQNHFSNFGKGPEGEHFCDIILALGHWPWRRCGLKVFLFLALAAIVIS